MDTCSKKIIKTVNYDILNDKPTSPKASLSLGMELGPNPCSLSRSASVYSDRRWSEVMPSRSRALRAGALILDRKSLSGTLSASQIGHVGQSELLK